MDVIQFLDLVESFDLIREDKEKIRANKYFLSTLASKEPIAYFRLLVMYDYKTREFTMTTLGD
jgi:hypothetical protein